MKRQPFFTLLAISLFAYGLQAQSWNEVTFPNDIGGVDDGAFFGDTGVVLAGYRDGEAIIHTHNFFQSVSIDTLPNETRAISFPNRTIGYISSTADEAGLLKSIDGGETWQAISDSGVINTNHGYENLLQFTTSDTGYSDYNENVEPVKDGLVIRRTFDHGLSWTFLNPLGTGGVLCRFQFFTSCFGYALENNTMESMEYNYDYGLDCIYKTMDCGNSWQVVSTLNKSGYADFFLIDPATVILAADSFIYKSVDSGATFSRLYYNPLAKFIYANNIAIRAISFAGPDTGYVAFSNMVCKTTDGGNSWFQTDFQYDSIDAYYITYIHAVSGDKVVVGTWGPLYYTTTGGGVYSGIEDIAAEPQLNIYPNPATGTLNISSAITNPATKTEIINTLGQSVYCSNQFKNRLDVSGLPPGLYFIQLQNEEQTLVGKFVKE